MPAAGFKFLSEEEVRILNRIEGGAHERRALARLLDNALELIASEIPEIPQSRVTNLTTALTAKLSAQQGAAVTNIATPASASAEDVATKLNALLASLRTAGIIQT